MIRHNTSHFNLGNNELYCKFANIILTFHLYKPKTQMNTLNFTNNNVSCLYIGQKVSHLC